MLASANLWENKLPPFNFFNINYHNYSSLRVSSSRQLNYNNVKSFLLPLLWNESTDSMRIFPCKILVTLLWRKSGSRMRETNDLRARNTHFLFNYAVYFHNSLQILYSLLGVQYDSKYIFLFVLIKLF